MIPSVSTIYQSVNFDVNSANVAVNSAYMRKKKERGDANIGEGGEGRGGGSPGFGHHNLNQDCRRPHLGYGSRDRGHHRSQLPLSLSLKSLKKEREIWGGGGLEPSHYRPNEITGDLD
ncbi:hypothetical protein CRG98_047392 [Punica granatum]|uniref:Uncharacterized protein n=1 Tax=Punica granatum TaxID=22663 RepID=A0A2I0HKN2_PUNGR|nr:hypothetical protein CRG98_047392 [Punica granatum]